jgi:hypothetical protein
MMGRFGACKAGLADADMGSIRKWRGREAASIESCGKFAVGALMTMIPWMTSDVTEIRPGPLFNISTFSCLILSREHGFRKNAPEIVLCAKPVPHTLATLPVPAMDSSLTSAKYRKPPESIDKLKSC